MTTSARHPRVVVGVCAMDKKTRSKPMGAILDRLHRFGEFECTIFGNECILEKPVEEWPLCDVLLSWFSDGFPLEKAEAYAKLRNPFQVNDLEAQHALMDR